MLPPVIQWSDWPSTASTAHPQLPGALFQAGSNRAWPWVRLEQPALLPTKGFSGPAAAATFFLPDFDADFFNSVLSPMRFSEQHLCTIWTAPVY